MSVVFVTGGTGYIGRSLIPRLLANRQRVRCLVRPGSEYKLPAGCEVFLGDSLRAESYGDNVFGSDSLVHLVGEPNPNPKKAEQFRNVDLASCHAAVAEAQRARIGHFIYVSVAHPAPVMHSYVAVRIECEEMIRQSGLHATILRPWYVLGPGHRWPYALKPLYWIAARIPSLRESAERLGLVTLDQMLRSLVWAVQNPAHGIRVMEVPLIRIGRAHEATAINAIGTMSAKAS